MGARKQFTPEFKREAVQLLDSGSRTGKGRWGHCLTLHFAMAWCWSVPEESTRSPLERISREMQSQTMTPLSTCNSSFSAAC